MSDVRKLAELGMSPPLAKELMAIIIANIAGSGDFATAVSNAVAAKTEVAALDNQSTAADIVAALQA